MNEHHDLGKVAEVVHEVMVQIGPVDDVSCHHQGDEEDRVEHTHAHDVENSEDE